MSDTQADMPAELPDTRRSGALRAAGGQGIDVSFLVGFSNLPIVRQIGLMIGLAASVALGFGVVLWSKDVDYRPLTGVVSARQANEVAEVLTGNGIPHRIDPASGLLLVPSDRIHEARMKMAGADIVGDTQRGFELFDEDQGFGVSQFMEVARYRRSLEGELARTITSINAVQHARVHLAIPKRTAFLRDQRKPTASVTLALSPGASLDDDQVQAVMNLVAGAVPELDVADVAVVDQRGKLLSRDDRDPALERTERELAYIQRVEDQLQLKVANILNTVAGPERFRAEVSADVDFTRIEQTEESYDPEARALRSEQSLEEARIGNQSPGGVPGALSNRPPGPAMAPETAAAAAEAAGDEAVAMRPEHSRVQATRNFEVDRTISHTRHQVGRIARLAVSVVVDATRPGGAAAGNGEPGAQPWTEAELQRIEALVKTAVGFSEVRGDVVTVASSPFYQKSVELVEPAPFWMESWFLELLKQVLGAIIVLLIVVVLLRPMFRSLSKAGDNIRTQQRLAATEARADEQGRALTGGNGGLPAPGEGDGRLESVRSMVAENPESVARVVKQWTMANE